MFILYKPANASERKTKPKQNRKTKMHRELQYFRLRGIQKFYNIQNLTMAIVLKKTYKFTFVKGHY